MNVVDILKDDYQRFPCNQSFDLYADDVYFKDPLNEFRGVKKYRKMIGFIEKWFIETHMELHDIQQEGHTISTQWTLHFTAPTWWKPRISIPGWSKLELNEQGLIASHIDGWNCSRFDVVKQVFPFL